MAKTILILGAGWAGLPLAHKLLKYTLSKVPDLKVILIAPNTHFYWNVAAVRVVIPGAISDSSLFLPISPGFAHYPASSFEFVLGKAERLDPGKSTVDIYLNDGTHRTISYDELVVATGSQIRSNLPFKDVGTHEETLEALHSLQSQIAAAQSIAVAGGGPTSVETAGEIAARYGNEKNITLIIGGEHVLQAPGILLSVGKVVEQDLKNLGVRLICNARVDDAQTSEKEDAPAQTTLTLSTGDTIVADLYLPLFGVRVNTSFVPKHLLDSDGNLMLEKTMRVAGTQNVWGIGDVGNIEPKQLTVTDAQIIHLSGALDAALTGGQVKEYKPSPKTMVFVTMGKKYATGQIGGWKLWGWLVAYVKGRTLFVDSADGYVGGKALRHASM